MVPSEVCLSEEDSVIMNSGVLKDSGTRMQQEAFSQISFFLMKVRDTAASIGYTPVKRSAPTPFSTEG